MEDLSNKKLEKVIIVGTNLGSYPYSLESSMKELRELVKADEALVIGEMAQNLDKFNPKYLIGEGKAREVKEMANNMGVDAIVFNDELTGIQLRNLEKLIEKKVIDRTNLILDIFALRAETYEAKLQVELAQLEYQLPRLLGIKGWSRTGGGIGTRGPGEQIIETDRRRLLREINKIKEKLKKAGRTRDTRRAERINSKIPIVSLVGYTNAGKSTILNRIKEDNSKEVFVKDMLFATLDPNSRRAKLPSGRKFLISDTVGFVSKLPTKLIEAFKSTLEEIKYSDLILHVIDISSEDLEISYKTTMEILKDLGIKDKKILTVFNKIDKIDMNMPMPLNIKGEKVYISAKNDKNLDTLLRAIEDNLFPQNIDVTLVFPYNDTEKGYKLIEKFDLKPNFIDEGLEIKINLSKEEYNRYKRYLKSV
ncbi:GTPase HflX [uncultured Peptoniphilus sp.]|uniref:GTPase HflX n=1 Tax=uncultured Peptoniphilus sp. TaxID=254354 RepID=UPI002804FA7E|nr:GTPase HflX [uncultured Peptoniphilus sp.]